MTIDTATNVPSADTASAMFLAGEALGYMYPAALRAAASLRVADQLAAGPLTIAELANRTGTHQQPLHRILRLLATRGVFREPVEGSWELTELAAALREDSQSCVRTGVLAVTTEAIWRSGAELASAARNGEPALDQIFGVPIFAYFQQNPDAGTEFHSGMGRYSLLESREFADIYPFPESGVLVDVGGGQGLLLVEVLRRHAGLRGILFDRPEVLAAHQLGEIEDRDRWELAPGDFFAAVPTGADYYCMQYILHNWNDDQCVRILRNCRSAMALGGRILVLDTVIPPGPEPSQGKLLDVLMLSIVSGKERTEAEFAALFAAAGLRLRRIIPKPGGALSIIEAEAAH